MSPEGTLYVLAFKGLAGGLVGFPRSGGGARVGGRAVGMVEIAEGFVAEGGGAAAVLVGEEVVAGGWWDGFHGGAPPGCCWA